MVLKPEPAACRLHAEGALLDSVLTDAGRPPGLGAARRMSARLRPGLQPRGATGAEGLGVSISGGKGHGRRLRDRSSGGAGRDVRRREQGPIGGPLIIPP